MGGIAADSDSELLADPDSSELPAEHRPYAALLLSKLYHYIGQDDEAVEFALRAGEAFEKEVQGEYRDTIIGEQFAPVWGKGFGPDYGSWLSR